MSLSPRFLDELRNRLSLSEIVGRRVKVTRAGREHKACCPFHHEKTPSFTINDDKQFYHCFGCGAHGDVIKFVMEHDNIAFMDAIEMLAAEAGMQVPKQTPQAAAKAKKEKDLYELLEDTTAFFEQYLREPRNADAMQYLLDRGFSPETIQLFRVGFAPEDGQKLRSYLKEREYTDKQMIDAGVLRPSTRGGQPYTFFRDRVMFPVPDRRGRIIAFGGRILPEHIRPPTRSDFTPPKYINSSETPLFHKGRMLYGEPTARRAAAEGQSVILVEGYLDVIACAQAGVKGALAPMGTAVTEDQIMAMWQMIPDFNKVPILCFDGDNAGRKAAARVVERVLPLLEPGRSVSFAFMPDGEDPDSLIKASGVKGFQQVIGRSLSLFDFIWSLHVAGRDFKTPEMRAGVIKQLENEVAKIADMDVQVHYKTLLRTKVSETFFPRKQFGRGQGAPQGRFVPKKPSPPKQQARSVFHKALLAAIINHPHIYDGIEDVFLKLSFGSAIRERLKQEIVGFLSDMPEAEPQDLQSHLAAEGYTQEIRDICNESVYVHASFASPTAKKEDVLSKWLAYWNDGNAAGLDDEIQDGWKRAYSDASEESENKLRSMLSERIAGKDT